MSSQTISAVHLTQPKIKYRLKHPLVGDKVIDSWMTVCELAFDVAADEVYKKFKDTYSEEITLIADEIITCAVEIK